MAKLIYSAITSLDGYVADKDGNFDWAAPDEEVHAAINDLERRIGTYLYGRRMYEVMLAWEDPDLVAGEPACMKDYANIWRSADKVVFSRSLADVPTLKTRIERDFQPDAVRTLKASAEYDVSVGGPELAGQAIAAWLVDEIHLFVNPILVGGGTQSLPDDVRLNLELVEERRFASGVVHLHYRVAP
jgi:dihydrofolate reductase